VTAAAGETAITVARAREFMALSAVLPPGDGVK
jgi:hypothetical protein